jgi:hypothetical protein
MDDLLAQLEIDGLPERDDPFAHWVGMPMFEQEDLSSKLQVIVHQRNEQDLLAFEALVGYHIPRQTLSIWYPAESVLDQKGWEYVDE